MFTLISKHMIIKKALLLFHFTVTCRKKIVKIQGSRHSAKHCTWGQHLIFSPVHRAVSRIFYCMLSFQVAHCSSDSSTTQIKLRASLQQVCSTGEFTILAKGAKNVFLLLRRPPSQVCISDNYGLKCQKYTQNKLFSFT